MKSVVAWLAGCLVAGSDRAGALCVGRPGLFRSMEYVVSRLTAALDADAVDDTNAGAATGCRSECIPLDDTEVVRLFRRLYVFNLSILIDVHLRKATECETRSPRMIL
jgi:hypothetical protein